MGDIIHLFLLAAVGFVAWLAGFISGVRSVPLDGAGLASGDDRAFDPKWFWDADLGAWVKRGGKQ